MIPSDVTPYNVNAAPGVNEISVAADPDFLYHSVQDGFYLDPVFGRVWDIAIPAGAAVYGRTDRLPSDPLDYAASRGFLRVPYRRVPRIIVRSQEELITLAAGAKASDSDFITMWRGQVQEYLVTRSESELMVLYGETNAFEPSLLASSSRSSMPFEKYMDEWFALLDAYIELRLTGFASTYGAATFRRLKGEAANLQGGYSYKIWAQALAQHYGLPSVGLDLTDRIDIAIFFALHRFISGSDGRMEIVRADASETPVIYLLGVFKANAWRDADLGPAWLQAARPKAQHAAFFGSGWGVRSNRAAESLVAAFYLEDHVGWRLPERWRELFPSTLDDPFLRYLLHCRDEFPWLSRVPLVRLYYLN